MDMGWVMLRFRYPFQFILMDMEVMDIIMDITTDMAMQGMVTQVVDICHGMYGLSLLLLSLDFVSFVAEIEKEVRLLWKFKNTIQENHL